ncbi:MAG: tyrosine-type recombinase/integrase [Clostridium sp.]
MLTPLEMEDYLDAAERLGYLPMFMLALTTGLRQGELIALKWSDLDIESRTLTIAEKRAVVRRELVEYGSQTRSIRLTPEVVDLLIMEHSKHPSVLAHVYAPGHAETLLAADGAPDAQ